MYPLVMYAQKRLCCLASALLLKREARLAALEEGFQAAQAKRRRRKVCTLVGRHILLLCVGWLLGQDPVPTGFRVTFSYYGGTE